MKSIGQIIIMVLFIVFSKTTIAQLQKVDTTLYVGAGANSIVRNVNIQSNGKTILTGEFNAYLGTPAHRIVRLNTNGNIDTSFHSGLASEGPIRATALLPNDQLIIGGLFNSYDGFTRKNIAKLNSDGTLDTSYAKGLGANNEITDMYLQSDGKLLITGFFSKYNNVDFKGFLRLTHDGEIDTTFKIGSGPNLSPFAMAQQSDSKIILVGSFVSYNGIPRNKIVRINLDGTLDTTFKNNTISNIIQKVLILNNDEIIITGGFTNIDGVTKTGIAKLSKDGVLDTSFNTYITGTVRSLHQQKDGKIILGGDFTNVNGVVVQRLVRLNTNGTIDNNFYAGFNGTIFDIAEQADKNIVLVGGFTQTTEVPTFTRSTPKLVRLLNTYCLPATTPKFNQNYIYACKGDSVEIKISEGELNDAQNWYWFTDSCTVALNDSGASIYVKANRNTTYFVRAENGCISSINPCAVFNVYIYDTLNTNVSINNSNYIQSEEINATYQWAFCDSTLHIIPEETNRVFHPINQGNYAVILRSFDGCLDTSECIYFNTSLGISNTKMLNIKNPITDNLIIPDSYKVVEVEIISILGQRRLIINSADYITKIPVDDISTGIYILKVKDKWNKTYTQKVLIQ